MYFSGSFAIQTNSTCEPFKVPQEKLVYNVYSLTITLGLLLAANNLPESGS